MIKDGGAYILYNKLKGNTYKWSRPCKKKAKSCQGDEYLNVPRKKKKTASRELFSMPTAKARAELKELVFKHGKTVGIIAQETGKTKEEVKTLFQKCDMPKRTYGSAT